MRSAVSGGAVCRKLVFVPPLGACSPSIYLREERPLRDYLIADGSGGGWRKACLTWPVTVPAT